jgi:hypothetical protein
MSTSIRSRPATRAYCAITSTKREPSTALCTAKRVRAKPAVTPINRETSTSLCSSSSRRTRIKLPHSYTALLERLCKALSYMKTHYNTTAAAKERWRRLATEWSTANRPLPLASKYPIDSPEYAACMRVFSAMQPLSFEWLLFLLNNVHANVQWYCQLYTCFIKGANDSIRPRVGCEPIPLLVQHVPDIMAVQRMFFLRCGSAPTTIHLGALLAAKSAYYLAMLAEATSMVAVAVESDGKEEMRLCATRSTEAALELLFALPSSRGAGFLAEVTHTLTGRFAHRFTPRFTPRERFLSWRGIMRPDHDCLIAATDIAKRFHGCAEAWAARSVWVTACVYIGVSRGCDVAVTPP